MNHSQEEIEYAFETFANGVQEMLDAANIGSLSVRVVTKNLFSDLSANQTVQSLSQQTGALLLLKVRLLSVVM